MEEMAASYRGPHKVILNRNPANLGLSAHVNRAVELSHGQLIVVAAGDDVSLPDRVDWLARAWQNNPQQIMLVQSGFVVVDELDTPLGTVRKAPTGREIIRVAGRERLNDYVNTLRLASSGATFAYNRRVFEAFGPLPSGVFHEDNVILLRALLLGEMWIVGVPLIHRRAHGGNMMIQKTALNQTKDELNQAERRASRAAQYRVNLYDAFAADLSAAKRQERVSELEFENLLKVCRARQEHFSIERDYPTASFRRKLDYLVKLRRSGVAWSSLRHWITRLLPWPVLRASKQMAAPFRKPEVDSILRGGEDFGLWQD
jgi:hypothetical protein